MPTYEYKCKSCGRSFEAFQSMSEAPLKDCPECGGEVKRLINGGGGIIFKGSGFYVTDRKSGAAARGSGGKPEAAGNSAGNSACASCPAAAASGGSCPAGEAKAAG